MTSPFIVEERVKSFLKEIPEKVTLIAVSKTVDADSIRRAIEAGIRDIGENKVQEALEKYPYLKDLNIKWHFIGRLQSNKVKKVLEVFDLIHSVDSFKLAEVISKEAEKLNKIQDVLLQVNISAEETKAGFSAEELLETLPELSRLKNIKILGLMTIGPNTQDESLIRKGFRDLKDLKERVDKKDCLEDKLKILSMGMTNDYKLAIEEGSNMIRIGRAIFGERN